METKHYQKGETVFQELSYGNTMYEIKSGRVGVYLSYGKPDETKLTETVDSLMEHHSNLPSYCS